VTALKFILTKEWVVGVTRTAVAYAYAFILAWGMTQWPDFALWSWLPAEASDGFVLVVGTVIYGAIRSLAEKWPQLGSLLIFNTKPQYAGVEGVPEAGSAEAQAGANPEAQ
jgi:hypothetical protein